MEIKFTNPLFLFRKRLLMIIMRTFIFLFCATVFALIPENIVSQNSKINIKEDKIFTVDEVFDLIMNQTDYKFFYEEGIFKDFPKVQVKKGIIKANKLLNQCLSQGNLDITISTNNTILIKEKSLNSIIKQQQFQVSGLVTDQSGQPLPGANIVEKGTTNGVVSDFDGNFSIKLSNNNAVLVVSYIGYAAKEIPAKGQSVVNISLSQEENTLDEVVVVGFGARKKSDLTGSVASADLEAFKEFPNASISQTLQGSLPGLNVGQVSTAGGNPDISVRGRTTISGNQNVFVILDGIPYSGNLSDLNPNDIGSITVLKDPSSKSIYGAQSANGVILVESKKGSRRESKPVITFTTSYTTQNPSNSLDLLDRAEFIEKAYDYDFAQTYQAPDYLEQKPGISYLDIVQDPELRKGFENGTDYDWWGNVTSPGFLQIHDLSVQGKSGKTSYLLSGGYTNQKGFIINDEFNRKTARINLETDVTDWLTVGARTSATFSDVSGNSPKLEDIRTYSPLVRPRDENGELIFNPMGTNNLNPFLSVLADDLDIRNTLIGNFFVDVDLGFIPGLNYRINYGNNYYWNKNFQSSPYDNAGAGSAFKFNSSKYDWTLDNILTYKRSFSDVHDLELTLLYGRRSIAYESTRAEGSNFSNLRLGYNDLKQAGIQNIFSNAYDEDYLYQMGRLNYIYNKKYLLTATLRRDGFSGFSKNNKIALFPSLAVGWNLSQESFFNAKWVNDLKFRGSYGASGNLVDRYSSLARVNSFPAVVFGDGGNTSFGQKVQNLSNPNLGWERTDGFNFGVDFSLFKYRLNGSVDYYTSRTSDLIFDVRIPEISGFQGITTNVGEVENHGLEINLESKLVRSSDWKWDLNFNFSLNRNKIVSLIDLDSDGDGQEDDLVASGLFIGESINSIYSYESDGIIQLGDDVPSGFFVGTHRIVDQNGDGKITPDDRVIIGREEPAYRFGVFNEIQYKNISLRFFINSIQGGKDGYLKGNEPRFGTGDNGRRQNLWEGLDYWTPRNPDAKYRRLDQESATDYRHFDSRSFVRLQDISLSYRFDSQILEANGIKDLKIFLSGKNLLTITDWSGWDPETGAGLETSARPVIKGISLGMDISF